MGKRAVAVLGEVRELFGLLRPISPITKFRLTLLAFLGALANLLDFLAIFLLLWLVGLLFLRFGSADSPSSLPFSRFIPSDWLPADPATLSNQVFIWICVLVIALLVVKSSLSLAISYATHRVAGSAASQVSRLLFERLMTTNRPSVSSRFAFAQRIFALLQGCNSGVSNGGAAVYGLLSDGILVILLIGVLLFINPLLGILSIFYLGFIFLLQNRLFTSYMRKLIHAESNSHTASNGWLNEVFRLYPEMHASGMPKNLAFEWSRVSKTQAVNNSMKGFLIAVPRQTFDIVVILGAALLIASQAFAPVFDLVLALTVVTFVIFRVLPALLRIQNYVLSLIWAITESRITREIWRSLEESEQQNLHKTASRQEPLDPSAPLTFKSVTFSYPDSVPAVRDASFELPATGLSVLQGESGAGKSTIIGLSLGLLSPAAGSIRVFGAEPEQFFDLRNGWVAYVPQRPQGISGTIKENVICYREETREPQFIYECLVRAGLEKVMSVLPLGINTPLSEFGGGVSGGELQRLVLARALYGRPKLLVLDEPFSALDVGLEESLSETLIDISLGISVLIATHRASFLTNAVQFLDLQHGELTVRAPSITGVAR